MIKHSGRKLSPVKDKLTISPTTISAAGQTKEKCLYFKIATKTKSILSDIISYNFKKKIN